MPDMILVEIAAALAGKAAESLYDLVKDKFGGRKQAVETLHAAIGEAPDSPQVIALARELEIAEEYDSTFREQLRAAWAAASSQAQDGDVTNSITGHVLGNTVQARDVRGNITF
jgi:hypothetical protein